MVEPSKISEKASELAGQAAQAAGPALEKAKVVAGELVEKAGPLIEKAAEMAAHGVSAAAEQIDKATGGKYSDKISTVSAKIEHTLDRDKDK
jgi:MT0933-like antitoxin protein